MQTSSRSSRPPLKQEIPVELLYTIMYESLLDKVDDGAGLTLTTQADYQENRNFYVYLVETAWILRKRIRAYT